MKTIKRFLKGEKGVTAVEYALIAGIIATAIAGAVTSLGVTLSGPFAFLAGVIAGAP